MLLNIVYTVFEAPIPLGHVRHEQMLYQTLRILLKVSRELNFTLQDFLINRHGVVVIKGVDARYHFVGQNTESPPVYRRSMALIEQDLGGEVFGRAAERVGSGFTVFCKTEVSKLEITFMVDEDIFGLEIPVYDMFSMQVFEH